MMTNLSRAFSVGRRRVLLTTVSYQTQPLKNELKNVVYLKRTVATSSFRPTKLTSRKVSVSENFVESEVDLDEELGDEGYTELTQRAQLLPGAGHQVFVVQPYVKWGPKKKLTTTPDLMLEEAKALVDSLPNWNCVGSAKTPLLSLGRKLLFGTGKLEELQTTIKQNPNVSAVFISVNQLSGLQREELEEAFKLPVFDRFSVVLQIFKERAKTREAKLQVAYAEIPQLRATLQHMKTGSKGGPSNQGGGKASIRGSGESYFEMQVRLLDNRENKIKDMLEKLVKKRAVQKLQRTRREYPVVAILGYTNSGKTTLIKALTGDTTLEPRNALFATLDVTTHSCRLPSGLSVLLVDTVGFISDIPTNLIAAFNATLRDALDADVLVHVRDASHPDLENQVATVNSTLASLNTELSQSLVEVNNKIDKLPAGEQLAPSASVLTISATEGTGLNELLQVIENCVLKATGRRIVRFRVANGGEEFSWLQKTTTIVRCKEDFRDPEFLVVETIMTQSAFGKFKSRFPHVQMSSASR